MIALLAAFFLGVLAFISVVEWIVNRIVTRRPTPPGSHVTRRWLHQNSYPKDGDPS